MKSFLRTIDSALSTIENSGEERYRTSEWASGIAGNGSQAG